MAVPDYYRSRRGRVFRVQRAAEHTDLGERYVLRAFVIGAVRPAANGCVAEAVHERTLEGVRDSVKRRIVVPTAERMFEQLWQNFRLELESL